MIDVVCESRNCNSLESSGKLKVEPLDVQDEGVSVGSAPPRDAGGPMIGKKMELKQPRRRVGAGGRGGIKGLGRSSARTTLMATTWDNISTGR